jgi:uncharacterized protein (TIGR00730 family)
MEHIRSLCVYCGSSDRGPAAHRDAARALGQELAQQGVGLVYGGGRVGVMGAIADAVLEGGGTVTGIIPDFLMRHEVGHEGVTQLEVVTTMHERKARMAELSDGFVVLPGGLGTLEELFEIVTWKQLGLHTKPIVVVTSSTGSPTFSPPWRGCRARNFPSIPSACNGSALSRRTPRLRPCTGRDTGLFCAATSSSPTATDFGAGPSWA